MELPTHHGAYPVDWFQTADGWVKATGDGSRVDIEYPSDLNRAASQDYQLALAFVANHGLHLWKKVEDVIDHCPSFGGEDPLGIHEIWIHPAFNRVPTDYWPTCRPFIPDAVTK
ncbi:Uncharacterised protein [Mycobacteroides abscessus subsp. abscessus]|uniref:hypothetical protein n=1 Tax=Mycobacteroides abscessus TaxID=36809 RepID=UPI00092BF285|nr:hypothetical protein [Mycobacteroides abscessus]SIG26081.1 Uncharacterised protein [Mycobacteroides abscessus subsp. abscessus]SIK65048.1 Uncharacterised protein [Mycobacteroides abscessus subsp. abscessus]SKF99707.1 Uncharacterised protein [Mycobacteroides abscessus subsp. abscessus]